MSAWVILLIAAPLWILGMFILAAILDRLNEIAEEMERHHERTEH